MVSFCRVDGSGLRNISRWANEHGYCVLPDTHVVFGEEKDRRAIVASLLEEEEFSDEGE